MAIKVKIGKKDKILTKDLFFVLLNDFIKDSYKGVRTKKNGAKISHGTIQNYVYLQKALEQFTDRSSFQLRLYLVDKLTQTEKEQARRYWKKFYKTFTTFMYDKLGYYDNYVGLIIKCLRSFFNYLNDDRSIGVGTFHKSFYVPSEEIPIIALNHEQLNYIIYNPSFKEKISSQQLDNIHDIFVFGCTVALRVSDLLTLSKKNLTVQNGKHYINVKSQKTGTTTSIKLPNYCVEIIERHKNGVQKTLLPSISSAWYNTQLKKMGKLIPDDFEIVKTRERRGKQVIVYKDQKKKTHYQLSDHISTHTMRRTAITTMLNLGMPEHLVRKISGHAANSKEFFRYVELSQSFIDNETDKIFHKLSQV